MISINLGNKEAVKFLRRLRLIENPPPVIKGVIEKIEVKIFQEFENGSAETVEEALEEKRKQDGDGKQLV